MDNGDRSEVHEAHADELLYRGRPPYAELVVEVVCFGFLCPVVDDHSSACRDVIGNAAGSRERIFAADF